MDFSVQEVRVAQKELALVQMVTFAQLKLMLSNVLEDIIVPVLVTDLQLNVIQEPIIHLKHDQIVLYVQLVSFVLGGDLSYQKHVLQDLCACHLVYQSRLYFVLVDTTAM